MKASGNARRPEEGPVVESDRIAVVDSAGNVWRLYEPEPGVLSVMLATTPSGDTAILIEPATSNLIRVRNRPLEWTMPK